MDLFIEMNWKYLPNAPSLGAYSMLRLKLSSFDVATIEEHERRSQFVIIGSFKMAFFLWLVRNQLS